MTREILIAGFGGQGVLSIGRTLAQAGLKEGYEVTWVPSYGPEMRGGTANCAVVLSHQPIGSPLVNQPMDFIAMNGPSLRRFASEVKPGGLVLVNVSQTDLKVSRQDVRTHYIPIMEEAQQLGNMRVANMVMLGAYIAATDALKMGTIRDILGQLFTGEKAHLMALNLRALEVGASHVRPRVNIAG